MNFEDVFERIQTSLGALKMFEGELHDAFTQVPSISVEYACLSLNAN